MLYIVSIDSNFGISSIWLQCGGDCLIEVTAKAGSIVVVVVMMVVVVVVSLKNLIRHINSNINADTIINVVFSILFFFSASLSTTSTFFLVYLSLVVAITIWDPCYYCIGDYCHHW